MYEDTDSSEWLALWVIFACCFAPVIIGFLLVMGLRWAL